MRALLSVEFWITLKTYLKGAPFYNALQTALHDKAKQAPNVRFYALYDKVYRKDVLAFAYECCKANGGASAGAHGLNVGLCWWILSALLAVGYFLFIYTMFRGKVRMEEGGY